MKNQNKLKLVLLLSAATLSCSALASTNNTNGNASGFYAGVAGSYDFMSADVARPSTAAPIKGGEWLPVATDKLSGNGLGLSITAGYDFYNQYKVPLRVALLYVYNTNADVGRHVLLANSSGTFKAYGTGTISSQQALVNVYYDFHNHSKFTPYVGGGLGAAFNQSAITLSNTPGKTTHFNEHSHSLAWDLEAGVNYQLSQHLSAGVFYRYVNAGRVDYNNSPYPELHGAADMLGNHLTYSQVGVGLNYYF